MSEYAGGFLLALPTGPSVKVDLAGSATKPFSSGDIELGEVGGPVGAFTVSAKVTARLDVTLDLPDDFDKDALSAHAYFVPGLLVTYNTNSFN